VGVLPSDLREAAGAASSVPEPWPLVAELVSGFADVEGDAIDSLIVRALGRVASHLGADRALYASLSDDRRRVWRTHAWGANPPGGAGPDEYELDSFPWISRHFIAKNRILYVPSFSALSEAAAADRNAWGRGVPTAAFVAGHGEEVPVGIIVLQWWSRTPSVAERDLRYFGVLADVVAAALRRKRAHEEHRGSERRLRHAEKLGFIERLAGGIAHDLNNALGVILGHAESASAVGLEGPEAVKQLSEIVHAVDAAKEMVARLLALARREPANPKPHELGGVVVGLESILRTFTGDRFRLEIRAGTGGPPVLIDAAALQRLVVDLIVSACDAMPGGGSLRIETAPCDPGGRECPAGELPACQRLSIVGCGTGMSENAFGRAEEHSLADASGVAGSLVSADLRDMVTRSGGTLTARACSTAEARVDIVLPATRLPLASPPGSLPATPPPMGRGETILLVEDEASLRQVTARVLWEQGYRVIEAADGAIAWWILTHTGVDAIDLVVTDVVMPNLSGTHLAKRLHQKRPSTRVLFVSGFSDDPVLAGVSAAHPLCVLAKPFTARSLAARVREILDGAPSPARDPGDATGAGDP